MKKALEAICSFALEVLFVLKTGTRRRTIRRVLRELSSLCLPPHSPGKCRLRDGYTASVVTTLWFMRLELAGHPTDPKHTGAITYWIDREKLVVHLDSALFGEDASVPLEHPLARRVLYTLKCFRSWCPIPMCFDGVRTPDGVMLPTDGSATSEHVYQKVIHG